MIKKSTLTMMSKEIKTFCDETGYDVAVLLEIIQDQIKVVKIFGDTFARPDLSENKNIDLNLEIYKNEVKLSKSNANFSFLPTLGIGSDCGFRIRKTPYIITFDEVLNAPEMPTEDKNKLKSMQKKFEDELQ